MDTLATSRTEFDREYWDKRYTEVISFMHECAKKSTKTLIEVAAQHPLIDGVRPNEEFTLRLKRGIELYEVLKKNNVEVEFYVPGSVHIYEGVTDKISLTNAGTSFLIEKGIDSAIVHGEDLNEKYKGADGVYNSADECFVTASYFKENNFGRLISVESPVQLIRKDFHYLYFGVWPMQHTAPALKTFHSPIKESYVDIPYVRDSDPGCQTIAPGTYAWTTRMERMPGFKEKYQK